MPNLFSVVIPNYNGEQYLIPCIQSVLNQSLQDFEIIIVDDGSKDESIHLIKGSFSDPRISIIVSENKGPSHARNLGLNRAKGDYVSFLDSDDIWKSNFLEKHFDVFKLKKSDLVFSYYKWFNSKREWINDKAHQNEMELFDLWSDSYISPSGCSFKRSSLMKIKGWDEDLWSCEDMDLWFRSKLESFKIDSTLSYDVLIRMHEISLKTNFQKMYHGHKLSLVKWMGIVKDGEFKKEQYKSALTRKIQKMRFYAVKMKNKRKTFETFKLGVQYLGFSYVNRLFFYQFFKLIIRLK